MLPSSAFAPDRLHADPQLPLQLVLLRLVPLPRLPARGAAFVRAPLLVVALGDEQLLALAPLADAKQRQPVVGQHGDQAVLARRRPPLSPHLDYVSVLAQPRRRHRQLNHRPVYLSPELGELVAGVPVVQETFECGDLCCGLRVRNVGGADGARLEVRRLDVPREQVRDRDLRGQHRQVEVVHLEAHSLPLRPVTLFHHAFTSQTVRKKVLGAARSAAIYFRNSMEWG